MGEEKWNDLREFLEEVERENPVLGELTHHAWNTTCRYCGGHVCSDTDEHGYEIIGVSFGDFRFCDDECFRRYLEAGGTRTRASKETRVWYDETTGRITEFDVVFNTDRDFGVDPNGEGPESIGEFDLRAIATHEAGHALGLKDMYDDDLSQMTMYYRSEPGSTIKISLESGDLDGLHALYGE